jgi:hypothetical protein
MPDTITNELIYEILKKLQATATRTDNTLNDIKLRMTNLEVSEGSHYASIAGRLDHLEIRLDRIEKRLELTEA